MFTTYSKIVKPKSVVVLDLAEDKTRGTFCLEPLQRGFGVTIGNTLRRVLLSSIRGTVFSSVAIEGCAHEFSSIEGVSSDVVDICLKLKKVVISSELEEGEASLSVTGPCVVTAGMISMPEGSEVINKDMVIFSVQEGYSANIKLNFKSGIGSEIVTKDNEDKEIGVIHLDRYYTPVKNVGFSIEEARVDGVIDYDKLVINIETNGSIDSDVVIGIASSILTNMLTPLIDQQYELLFDQNESEEVSDAEGLDYDLNLLRKTSDLELSVRAANCFSQADIEYVGALVSKTELQLLKMNNFGRKSLDEIKACLSTMNLKLGMDIQWPPRNFEELLKAAKQHFENN